MSVGGRTLFENASFQVNYGDRVALVGPNGAGKSTLFSIILKRQKPDEGAVESRVGLIVRMRDGSHFQVLVIQTDGTAPVSAKDGVS